MSIGFGSMIVQVRPAKLLQSWDYGSMSCKAKNSCEIHKSAPVFFSGKSSCLEEVVGMKRIS
ncbi:hypothetical protein LR48_Vigan03g174600 [Vigna angularis]|uniref:Uncharacterized protein n=1 Tax=Phaseolus angularis TaxID=3914 RepID=A0A0L9U7E1_PHAAN|nr:hypothetical protein LR48_Vigan03g174600 [Vigna angularis]